MLLAGLALAVYSTINIPSSRTQALHKTHRSVVSYVIGIIRKLHEHRFELCDVLGDVDHFACVDGGGLEGILALYFLDAAVVGLRDSPRWDASFSVKVQTPLQPPLRTTSGACWMRRRSRQPISVEHWYLLGTWFWSV